jgi:hypothetical protein
MSNPVQELVCFDFIILFQAVGLLRVEQVLTGQTVGEVVVIVVQEDSLNLSEFVDG